MSKTRPFVCSSVCDAVSTTKFCPSSVKFGIETLYIDLSEKRDFRENRPSDSHILLVGVNKSLSKMFIFLR
jgi:hypothetical protein